MIPSLEEAIMNDKTLQFNSEDGNIYIFNQNTEQWFKLSPMKDRLPFDVKEQLKKLKEKADALEGK